MCSGAKSSITIIRSTAIETAANKEPGTPPAPLLRPSSWGRRPIQNGSHIDLITFLLISARLERKYKSAHRLAERKQRTRSCDGRRLWPMEGDSTGLARFCMAITQREAIFALRQRVRAVTTQPLGLPSRSGARIIVKPKRLISIGGRPEADKPRKRQSWSKER